MRPQVRVLAWPVVGVTAVRLPRTYDHANRLTWFVRRRRRDRYRARGVVVSVSTELGVAHGMSRLARFVEGEVPPQTFSDGLEALG